MLFGRAIHITRFTIDYNALLGLLIPSVFWSSKPWSVTLVLVYHSISIYRCVLRWVLDSRAVADEWRIDSWLVHTIPKPYTFCKGPVWKINLSKFHWMDFIRFHTDYAFANMQHRNRWLFFVSRTVIPFIFQNGFWLQYFQQHSACAKVTGTSNGYWKTFVRQTLRKLWKILWCRFCHWPFYVRKMCGFGFTVSFINFSYRRMFGLYLLCCARKISQANTIDCIQRPQKRAAKRFDHIVVECAGRVRTFTICKFIAIR